MIWPLKRRPLTEAVLWDYLDACAIPFREPASHWLEHGHQVPSVYDPHLDYCVAQDSAPFIPSLDTELRAEITDYTDLDAPLSFWGAVRDAGNFQLNYARAIAELVKLFGKGSQTSSANTVSRTWHFGHARITCTVWPPDKQTDAPSERQKRFPETRDEARIEISPAWRAPLSTEERANLATAQTLWQAPDLSQAATLTTNTRDWPKGLNALPQGIAITSTGDVACIQADGLVDLIPRTQITRLSLTRSEGTRAGRGASLRVKITVNRRADDKLIGRTLATVTGDPNALDDLAKTLSKRIDVPLDTTETPAD